ncbi:MAG: hypothetical protein P8K77_03395 [Polaribacter sp.]|nr:hypothetical protein [Polaribacter sp.]
MRYPVYRPITPPRGLYDINKTNNRSILPYFMSRMLSSYVRIPIYDYPSTFEVKLRAVSNDCSPSEWLSKTFQIFVTPGIIPNKFD